jgi:hypothetical protein
MPKKKSYMNKENILSEGWLSNIVNIYKFVRKNPKLSKKEKKLIKSVPGLAKELMSFKSIIAKSNEKIRKQAKDLGLDPDKDLQKL